MRQKLPVLMAVLLCAFFYLFALQAHAKAAFFSGMPDVPVMKGLQELPQFNLSYDKPEGRITETLAAINSAKPEEIKHFYVQTLPQLGWQKIDDVTYRRGDEVLELRFEVENNSPYLRLMIRPAG